MSARHVETQPRPTAAPVIRVRDLQIHFRQKNRFLRAVDGVSFDLFENEILGIVGETGSGKSVTGRSMMGLLPVPPAVVAGGSVTYRPTGTCPFCQGASCSSCGGTGAATCAACDGTGCSECEGTGRRAIDLLNVSPETMRQLRGRRIAMIFQDASKALNPVLSIRDQVAEVFLQHRSDDLLASLDRPVLRPVRRATRQEARYLERQLLIFPPFRSQARRVQKTLDDLVAQALADVQIGNPRKVMESHPHQLSGGMKQRVMIAQAMACNPDVLIADEPTTALDTTVQARILELILEMRQRAAVLYISHDLSVVRMICDRVGVMYAGTMAEIGSAERVFQSPDHPYTRALLGAVPSAGRERGHLAAIKGLVPEFTTARPLCRFHDRCFYAVDLCRSSRPREVQVEPAHSVACFGYGTADEHELHAPRVGDLPRIPAFREDEVGA